MQLLVRSESSAAIYTDYNKVCKMKKWQVKEQGSTTHWNSRPDTEKREHHTEWQVLHRFCWLLLHFWKWWAFGKYSENKRHIFQVSDMTEKTHTIHHRRRWKSEYQMLSIDHSERIRKDSLILMAKAKQKRTVTNWSYLITIRTCRVQIVG